MKKTIGMLTTYAGAAVLAASFASVGEVKAQTTTPSPAPAAAQGECSAEAKLAIYNEFRSHLQNGAGQGLRTGQEVFGVSDCRRRRINRDISAGQVCRSDGQSAPRAKALSSLVYEKKDFPKAFELGKQILADEPDNLTSVNRSRLCRIPGGVVQE